jgi:hypothetical protein
MRHAAFGSGTLPNATPVVVAMADAPLPATAILNSSDAGRKIEVSLDGTVYFTPVYDSTLTGQIAVSLLSDVFSLRFTGAAAGADTWSVL